MLVTDIFECKSSEPCSDNVACRDFIEIVDDQGNTDTICGQAYPENTVFFAEIGQQNQLDTSDMKSIWYIAETSSLHVGFESDKVLGNLGASMTFKCSNSDQIENTDGTTESRKFTGHLSGYFLF